MIVLGGQSHHQTSHPAHQLARRQGLENPLPVPIVREEVGFADAQNDV